MQPNFRADREEPPSFFLQKLLFPRIIFLISEEEEKKKFAPSLFDLIPFFFAILIKFT